MRRDQARLHEHKDEPRDEHEAVGDQIPRYRRHVEKRPPEERAAEAGDDNREQRGGGRDEIPAPVLGARARILADHFGRGHEPSHMSVLPPPGLPRMMIRSPENPTAAHRNTV